MMSSPRPRGRQGRRRRLAAAVLVFALGGCVVVPRTAAVYDDRCRVYLKQVVLEQAVLGSIGHCHNQGCLMLLASAGVITAVSAVVSGSVAMVGNIVYWAERGGQCPTASR
jgi:hypothetical protein